MTWAAVHCCSCVSLILQPEAALFGQGSIVGLFVALTSG